MVSPGTLPRGTLSCCAPFAVGVRFLPVHPFSDEVGGAFGAGFVGGFEDDSVAKIQHRDFGPLPRSESREERELGLCGHNGGGIRLPDHVNVGIGFRDEALRFILPANEEVVFLDRSFGRRARIESPEDVGVKK